MTHADDIARNLSRVRERVAVAAERAGRDAASITLVAVSKTHPVDVVTAARAAGQLDFGENYAQELTDKAPAAPPDVRWHYIGRLQTNKVKFVAPVAHLVHTVDSERLARELDRRAALLGRRIAVLLQVNLAGEEQKGGVSPDELPALLDAASSCAHLDVRGLMTMPPFWPAERVRPFFAGLRELRDRHASSARPLAELSMGMSGDFEVAIAEGATIVRVGTAIFGVREP